MGKTYVFDRVTADLACGFTHPAIQRLSSLVAAYPADLDLRQRLAAVHRRVGNRIQAGRWDYLTIGADVQDTLAFERAFPSARARLREVRWPHRAGQAATAYARTRLEKLVAAAEAERAATTGPAATAKPRHPSAGTSSYLRQREVARLAPWVRRLDRLRRSARVPRIVVAVALAAAAFFVGLGAVTVVEWIIH